MTERNQGLVRGFLAGLLMIGMLVAATEGQVAGRDAAVSCPVPAVPAGTRALPLAPEAAAARPAASGFVGSRGGQI